MPRKREVKTPPKKGDPVSKSYIPKETRNVLKLREQNKHANAWERLIINERIEEAKQLASLKSELKRDSHPARHRSLPPLEYFLKPQPVVKTEGTRKSTRITRQPVRFNPAEEEQRQKKAQEKARKKKKKGLTEEQLKEFEFQEYIELQRKEREEKAKKELEKFRKEQLQEQLQIQTRRKQGLIIKKTQAEADYAKLEDLREQQKPFILRLTSKVKEYIQNQLNPDEDY